MPALPPRNKSNHLNPKTISEYIARGDYNLNVFSLYIDDESVFFEHFDIFEKLCARSRYGVEFSSYNYDILKKVEKKLKDKYTDISLALLDDFVLKDRSYINPLQFEKTKLIVPQSYIMWMPTLRNIQPISLYLNQNRIGSGSSNSINSIDKNGVIRIKDLIQELGEKWSKYDNLSKVILISDYIQNDYQFVEGIESEACDGIYVVESPKEITTFSTSDSVSVFQNKYGLCCGIATLLTLLLNNPIMRVNMNNVYGSGHVWNIVCINGKYYYVDNTWCISRNPNRYEEALKASNFTDKYLLFGLEEAQRIGHHSSSTFIPNVEEKSFDREQLTQAKEKILTLGRFNHYQTPILSSRKK